MHKCFTDLEEDFSRIGHSELVSESIEIKKKLKQVQHDNIEQIILELK
jgi:hypothetical protein